ncbi:MAG: ComEC/Rec2 family competence protein [Chthoniobacterales bacterium]
MKDADRWPRQPMLGVALAAMVGIVVADLHPLGWIPAGLVVGATAAIVVLTGRSIAAYLFVAAAFFFLHSVRMNESAGQRLVQLLGEGPRAITARGDVASEPKISGSGTATFTLSVRSVEMDGVSHAIRAKLLVRWKHAVQFGDNVAVFGTTASIAPPRNPGEFDMRQYLAREDIYRELTVGYSENGVVARQGSGNMILRAAQTSRTWLQRVLSRGLEDSPDVVSMINGVVLGLRHQTAEDIEEPFQQTGTLHLFAVAGLHVGIVAQLLWILAAVARLPRKWATAFVIPALFFYAAVTGLHTSSVRAATMSAVLLSGLFAERKVFSLNSLATAAVLILAWNTNELFGIGFQLSFAVVGAIILITGPAFGFLIRKTGQDPFLPRTLYSRPRRAVDRILWRIAAAASVSLAAWIGSLPLMLYYYHLVTPVSLIANLAVVPIAFLVLAGALVSALCAPVSTWGSVVFNNANWLLGKIILGLVHLFAQMPGGHFYLEHLHWPSGARIELTALDLGTGGAIHLRAGNRDWLFDTGRGRDFNRTLRPYLRSRGINRLEMLLLTHGDAAHIGGAADVLDVFVPRAIIASTATDRSSSHRSRINELSARAPGQHQAAAGDEWRLSPDVAVRILFPPKDFHAPVADDQAIVTQIILDQNARVLLLSDSGEMTERALLASGADLRSDVIIKGQHRSGVSASPEFLDAVKPQLIIATSRDFPESERIKEEWVEKIRGRSIRLLRQDETGAVQLRVFRDGWEARPYLGGAILRSSSR